MKPPDDERTRSDPLAAAIYDWLDPEQPGRAPTMSPASRNDRRLFDSFVSESNSAIRSSVDPAVLIAIANHRNAKAIRLRRGRRITRVVSIALAAALVATIVLVAIGRSPD